MTDMDLTAATEAAWTAFRGRVADHVAAMADGDLLVVAPADLLDDGDDDDDGGGAAAVAVQVRAFGGGLVRLDWEAPLDQVGWEDVHHTAERREADRVAVLLVRTLREVHGVPHPAFLTAGGLEVDPDVVAWPGAVPADPVPDGDVIEVPRDREHLQRLVDAAMQVVFPDLRHDADGDIPVRDGESALYVRVLPDRPVVELYAELVVDPVDADRLSLEAGLLNAAHPTWKFVHRETTVVMTHQVVAVPFVASQLRVLVDLFLDDLDRLSGELVARVGGRRFLQPAPPPGRPVGPAGDHPADPDSGADLVLTGLLELCHMGRPRAATVAGLFDHDRLELIRQIVRVRSGQHDCGGLDQDVVLTALRQALRLVSDGQVEQPTALAPRPRSVQASLLADADLGEDALDLGWSA
ncbi:hypothetical protein [Nocardioides sp. 1609]|uniref:T3SS (YopN, CesT) and YbjN peptide-binding chaperone 1 n=1 Tax=Nocardioides sp. 1609 TaxID=2508327 RepID=UPI001430F56F|nr:hypothetical protein [Nocardioides sp. 1609]